MSPPAVAAAPPGGAPAAGRGRRGPRAAGRAWRRVPRPVRRVLAGAVGSALVLLGAVLIVLPGPFTIPPMLLGLAILGSEFGWARRWQTRLADSVRQGARRVRKRSPRS